MRKLRKILFLFIFISILLVQTFEVHASFPVVNLPYWFSNTSNTILRWTGSQVIYHHKLNNNASFAFVEGVANGVLQWNSALGLSNTTTTLNENVSFRIYGGTRTQLNQTGYFNITDTSLNGQTFSLQETPSSTYYMYNGSQKYGYIFQEVLVAVIENSDLSTQNYIKTATHEIGHALGWRGHPVNNNTTLSWVMREGVLTNTTLQLNEKRHLGQIYPTSPYYSN